MSTDSDHVLISLDDVDALTLPCPTCDATGEWNANACWNCEGTGRLLRLASTPDGPRIVAFTRTALGFGHWLSETAEDEYWLFRAANHEQLVYLQDPTVVYDATGHDQRGHCAPWCNCPF